MGLETTSRPRCHDRDCIPGSYNHSICHAEPHVRLMLHTKHLLVKANRLLGQCSHIVNCDMLFLASLFSNTLKEVHFTSLYYRRQVSL